MAPYKKIIINNFSHRADYHCIGFVLPRGLACDKSKKY